jgi:hypothetical protein
MTTGTLSCSFCGKTQHQVAKLIAGPTVFICDECVRICVDILAQPTGSSAGGSGAAADRPDVPELAPLSIRCAMCQMMTPPQDLLPVEDRGGLCPGCVAEIEAALEARRQQTGDAV